LFFRRRKIAVVSSMYGDYDEISAPPKQTVNCEWVLVTDRPRSVPEPWRVVVEPRPLIAPWLAAKIAKCSPQLYADADIYIWIDSNVEILSPLFVAWCISSLGDEDLCQHRNFDWKSIHDEVKVSLTLDKYAGVPIREQAAHYISQGMPHDIGSWWGGLIIKTKDCPDFGTPWLAEMVRWSCSQDQISHQYIMHTMGLHPVQLDIDLGGDMRRIDASHWVMAHFGGDFFRLKFHNGGKD
jgi:hypothetical protein